MCLTRRSYYLGWICFVCVHVRSLCFDLCFGIDSWGIPRFYDLVGAFEARSERLLFYGFILKQLNLERSERMYRGLELQSRDIPTLSVQLYIVKIESLLCETYRLVTYFFPQCNCIYLCVIKNSSVVEKPLHLLN